MFNRAAGRRGGRKASPDFVSLIAGGIFGGCAAALIIALVRPVFERWHSTVLRQTYKVDKS